jgi:hypothetical protein
VSLHWFPDNTVLCNFATVGALALLEQVLDGRGRWVEAIAHEAEQSARYLPALAQVGPPITTRDTADLVSEAIAYGCVGRDAGYRLLLDMRAAGRFLRVPDHRDRL